MIEPPLVFVFGPYIRYSDGNPGTVIPRCACGAVRPRLAQGLATRPTISIGNMKSVVLKPVP